MKTEHIENDKAISAFIEDAIKGGWIYDESGCIIEDDFIDWVIADHHVQCAILLDPEAWKAVGKVRGDNTTIPDNHCRVCGEPMPEGETMFYYHGYSSPCPKPPLKKWKWRGKMHTFIDHLADGKSINEALEAINN